MSIPPTLEAVPPYDPKWGPEPRIRQLSRTDKDRGLYPLIDSDPHFKRVMRYLRPSDYAIWGGSILTWPSLMMLWGECAFGCVDISMSVTELLEIGRNGEWRDIRLGYRLKQVQSADRGTSCSRAVDQ
jgi:hypothetical protein